MSQERIRVLVDRSRDSGWASALVDMEPDTIYQTTDNRGRLSWSVLKNYDVLTICGYSPLEYADEELELMRRFVEAGGGLLLASSTSRFQQDTDRPILEMCTGRIARIFGADFLSVDKCRAETKSSDDLLRGYPREKLRLVYHAALADLELDDIPIVNCGTIDVPADARAFLEHRETCEPVGACLKFGEGRVLLINDLEFSHDSQMVCRAFINWLAQNRLSRVEGSETIPDEILVDEHVKEDGNIRIYYTDRMKDRVDTFIEFARKIKDDLISKFTDTSDMFWEIELSVSCSARRFGWHERVTRIGGAMSNPRLAYIFGTKAPDLINIGEDTGGLLWYAGFGWDAIVRCFGIMAMKVLGFGSEAGEMYAEIVRQFQEKDPTGKEFDVTRAYEYHPKSLWVLISLMEKYGQDLLSRFSKLLPEDKNPRENIPGHFFTAADVLVYYLSLAAGEDLYPWFRDIGTELHPLPLHPTESEDFRAGVRQYLNDMIRDRNAAATDRMGAVLGMMDVYEKESKKMEKESPPSWDPVSRLGSEDKYESLVAAMWLVRTSDSRAVYVLRELASDADRTLSAIAAYALVWKGIDSAADRLLETASGQDYRFQLDAGYALLRIGHEKADKLSFKGLKDENGNPVVGMRVEYDGDLKLFPTVEGHEVANIFTAPNLLYHFPKNVHVSSAYVDWVHTGPPYRRKGLSRWAMEETFKHHAVRRAACATLGTGTRNTAHAMYRSFGFVDVFVSESFTKKLKEETAKMVEGLVIRSYSPGDEVRMAALMNECYSHILDQRCVKARRPRLSNTYIRIAEKDGEMLGYALAKSGRSRTEAQLQEIWVKKADDRNDIGAALLCSLHNDLFSRGFKEITMSRENLMELRFLRELLQDFGYSYQRDGGVDMFRIINLPMLLEELSPLLVSRLKDSDYEDWNGEIGIMGEEHKASVKVSDRQISVSECVSENTDILISGGDDTITRIVIGRMTPFEAYLQIELSIKPMVNDRVTGLLETLFPRIPRGTR